MRGMRGVGSGGAKKMKAIPARGRNVEGATYTVTDQGGERMVRCKACEVAVPVAKWWGHVCGKAQQDQGGGSEGGSEQP